MTLDAFLLLHRFMNTTQDTPLGRGLGLPVGDSFFLFASPDSPNRLTLFEGVSEQVSPSGEFLLESARAGVIDTLHTFGDFTSPAHFSRELARRGLDRLERAGVRLRVWINHGKETNVQCLGATRIGAWRGDDPKHAAYHADLTVSYGFRFFWPGLFLGEAINCDGVNSTRSLAATARAALRELRRRPQNPLPLLRLIYALPLRDGQHVLGFNRFAGTGGQTPVAEDLPRQLSRENLASLVRSGGSSIVYQHLAVRRRAPGFGTGSYRPNTFPYLEPEERSALERLAEAFHGGDVLVETTSRLLTYNALVRWLRYRVETAGDHLRILLLDAREPKGRPRFVQRDELEGLTFYTPRPDMTEIWIQTATGDSLVRDVRCNPTDHTGRQSVSVPLTLPALPTS